MNPITGTPCCCARAVSGQAMAAPPSRVTKSRRLTGSFSHEDRTLSHHQNERPLVHHGKFRGRCLSGSRASPSAIDGGRSISAIPPEATGLRGVAIGREGPTTDLRHKDTYRPSFLDRDARCHHPKI